MGEKKSSKNGVKSPRPPNQKRTGVESSKLILLAACLAIVAGITQKLYFASKTLPPKLPPIEGLPVNKGTWGTYRAHTYFGLSTRELRSPVFGMMWYKQPREVIRPDIRHWCDHGDKLQRYSWDAADGRTFGVQNITESSLKMKIEWINHLDTWTARIKFTPLAGTRQTLLFYLAAQESQTKFTLGKQLSNIIQTEGEKYGDSKFSVNFAQEKEVPHSTLVWDDAISLTHLNNLILDNTGVSETKYGIVYQLRPRNYFKSGRFAAIQFNIRSEVTFDISFSSRENDAVSKRNFDVELGKRLKAFNDKFEKAFNVENKGYTASQLDLAKVALSNMLGSLGFWHGYNKVALGKEIVPYGPHTLFSAIPSRAFFPRGFLWDEGFHNMLISKFDPELTIEILTSWLNTMNEDGWIPREMILGEESESRVPAEYIVQKPDVANPPSLFLVFDRLVHNPQIVAKHGKVLASMYPKLEKWFSWLSQSQRGKKKGTFRWRGRNDTTELELNPKTLASGLDDFPRASHPSSDEYHLDLRCWMAVCSRVMHRLSSLYGTETEKTKYKTLFEELNDYDSLVNLHWSDKTKTFHDYGKHSAKVKLASAPSKTEPGVYVVKRVVETEPKLSLVENVFGYNSLFPLMMRMIPADAEELVHVLKKLRDPKEMWTNFGLRSVSQSSPYYAARNSEHDPPYWRGNIWINMNYLVLSSLKYYSTIDGPMKENAAKTFLELRQNLMKNMAQQFEQSGYLWEHYDDRNGKGGGTHPFTGWSSLVLLIMGDASDITF